MAKPVELIDIGGKKVSKTSTGKRKFHNKSKFGCDNCKRRRVKCDETKPSCQKCQRMGLTCVYSPPQPRKRRKRAVKDPTTNPTTVKQETQIDPSILNSNNTTTNNNITTTDGVLSSQGEMNSSLDPPTLDYIKKINQLQQLQQQQAILLSQINSSIIGKKENTPEFHTLSSAGTNTNNIFFTPISTQESVLLPPLVANTPIISNIETHATSSTDRIPSNLNNNNNGGGGGNNTWSNSPLNLTPTVNLQSLGLSVPGNLNNNFSPKRFNSASLNSMTPSANSIYKSLNNSSNVLPLVNSSNNINNNNNNTPASLNNINLASGYDQNYLNSELQNLINAKNIYNTTSTLTNLFSGNNPQLLNGNIDLLPFGKNNKRFSNDSNNRTLKANNAEVALANMQQEQQQQISSRNNAKEGNKISTNLGVNHTNQIKKNTLKDTTIPNVSNHTVAKDKLSSAININNQNDDIIPKLTDSQMSYSISNSSTTDSIDRNELQITESTSPINSSSGEQSPLPLDTIPRLIELSSLAQLDLVDIKLFHHYYTTVWETITAAGISGPEVWKTYIPNLAFDFPFLMHTILAFSASHLSRTEVGLEPYMSSHRLEALKLLREAVLEISEENTDALVASSLILIMDSLANASNTTTSSDSNTAAWIFHVKGAITILTAVWPLAESSKFYNLISVDLSDLSDVVNQENRTISDLVCFDESISDLYPVEIDSPYLITLAYLDQLHREKNQLDFLLRVFAFPALLDRTFLSLLMTGDISAMRIMRSYYKMLRGFTTEVKDRVWFLEGVSQALPQDVDEYSGGGGMHMMLDFLGGGLPSMTTTNFSEFM